MKVYGRQVSNIVIACAHAHAKSTSLEASAQLFCPIIVTFFQSNPFAGVCACVCACRSSTSTMIPWRPW